jgi:lauroyl/myristoyl acyltransferase
MPASRHFWDLLELFVLPGLSVVLPWRVSFALYGWLAQFDWLYAQQARASLNGARRLGVVRDSEQWLRQYRRMLMVDHADLFLSVFRRQAWLRRHVRLTGSMWPTLDSPFMAVTFHWGAGLWGLRHLKAQGRDVAVLVRDIPLGAFKGRPIVAAYAGLRSRQTAAAGGVETVRSSVNSLRELKRRLGAGQNLVALLDVPAEGKKNVLRAPFLGRIGVFPRGLAYLAAKNRIPVVAYTTGLDPESGDRLLDVSDVIESDDESVLMGFLVDRLERAIYAYPANWHQWAGVGTFFSHDGT